MAADAANGEAQDGLQRVAGVLGGRFEEALTAARFDEAAQTLANFKLASPADPRGAQFELRLYNQALARALADSNLERAALIVRQGQQSGVVPADVIAKWRADISRRVEDAKVTHLAGLVQDRIHDGRLADGEDSAKSYLAQLAGRRARERRDRARAARHDRRVPEEGA